MSYVYAPTSPYDPREPWARPNSPRVEAPPLYTATITGTDTAGTVTISVPPGPTPSQEIEVVQTVTARPQIARIDFALPPPPNCRSDDLPVAPDARLGSGDLRRHRGDRLGDSRGSLDHCHECY